MRTTLKRGVGRGAELNGNGHAVYPPAAVSAVARYEQPLRPGRTGLALVGRILLVTLLAAVSLALAAAGGLYLWFQQSVAAIRCHESDCRIAQKRLVVTPPGQAAIALLVGYDYRVGDGTRVGARSDTVMLVRADPSTKTISLLSFPRDLIVPIYCKTGFVTDDRINSAFSRCGSTGTLETVKHLTGLPVNYLIKVDFHGFKEIVDQLGGVWIDVDRRYYNRNVGSYATNFAHINLQPGYQRLGGGPALGNKLKTTTPPPQRTRVTVLNGNEVAGAAANASYLLAQRGYLVMVPPNGLAPNAPTSPYFHSQIYFDKKQKGAKEAAVALQKLLQPADVRPLPKDAQLRALDPGSMLLVIVGQTFHNTLPPAPVVDVPERTPAYVRYDRGPGEELLRPMVPKVPFRL